MKFLSVRDLRSKPAEVWKGLAATIRHAKAVAAVTEMAAEDLLSADPLERLGVASTVYRLARFPRELAPPE